MGGRLEGKTAIVTGGSSGIGRASALRFAEEGAGVVIAVIRPDPREGGQSTHEVVRANGGRAEYIATDVINPAAVDALVTKAIKVFGDFHIIMTAAGTVGPTGDSRLVDITEFDQHLALNLRATFLCVQRSLRHFAEKRYGKVVTVASNFGLVGVPQLTAYCAGKAAVIGMTRALAIEFGPVGLNINALCPGATRTAINVHFRADPEVHRVWQQMTPLRMADANYTADPRDMANAALYLASDESRFMTGACLVVDGGWIAQ